MDLGSGLLEVYSDVPWHLTVILQYSPQKLTYKKRTHGTFNSTCNRTFTVKSTHVENIKAAGMHVCLIIVKC